MDAPCALLLKRYFVGIRSWLIRALATVMRRRNHYLIRYLSLVWPAWEAGTDWSIRITSHSRAAQIGRVEYFEDNSSEWYASLRLANVGHIYDLHSKISWHISEEGAKSIKWSLSLIVLMAIWLWLFENFGNLWKIMSSTSVWLVSFFYRVQIFSKILGSIHRLATVRSNTR